MNRRRLLDVANRPDNFLGMDRFGNSWFAEWDADGAEVWVQVRNEKITNGGINSRPRFFEGAIR